MTLRAFAGGAVFGEVHGQGSRTVVLCHGWRRDRSDLADLAARLVDHFGVTTAAIDLPGFGTSPPPDAPVGAAGYGDVLARVLEEVRGDDPGGPAGGAPVVLGHSFGGRVAVCCAASRPDLVGGLVLTGVPLLRAARRGRAPLPYRLARGLWSRGLVPDATMERVRYRYGSADYRAARGVMRDVLVRVVNEDYRDELGRVACPTALCWGSDDAEAPLAQAREAARLIDDVVRFDEVPGAGHDLHLDRPDVLVEAVGAVIDPLGSGRPGRRGSGARP